MRCTYMRLSRKGKSNSTSIIKVRIVAIKGDTIECAHISSNFKLKAFYKEEMNLEPGQIVLLEYSSYKGVAGYIVVDDLSEVIEANALEVQHIISDGKMYTSLILENPDTKRRIHSLIHNESPLFRYSNTIVRGDKVKIKMNNGEVFNIQRIDE